MKLRNNNVDSSSSSRPTFSLLDPNPSLIDKDGTLINNIDLAASLTTNRNGTIADGVSKLILVVSSKNQLQFSINDTKPDDLANGTLRSLNNSNINTNLSSEPLIYLKILEMENQLLPPYIHLQTLLIIMKQEVIEQSTLMSQIRIILLIHFLKFQYISIVLPLFLFMAYG